ncbi:hypothetical protein F7725_028175 [Dissostichus mawsoni]|uniref:Cadherin Y-type LIR-motif domain-containing protein n=1 Tax=Dissostichus mawsoni TaxID=36200 RepID=A0A7J5XG74_DISMA|nr:hypothetical protein F7725_028175 [Dissostichus mawsoni]
MCALPAKDCSLEYHFEGQGSAGSVSCPSLLETDNDLQFLDDLGPKFKILSDICSPPKPKPKPSLTHNIVGAVKTTVNLVEPDVRPKVEQIVETEHTDVKKETVMSSTNISKSSVNTVSTAHQYMTLPTSKVTNITHYSATLPPQAHYSATLPNQAHYSATLPPQAHTVFIQPVYYNTSPVPQPMHYVVQPQLQNMVMMVEGAHGANFPGFYVVRGTQSPSSGLVISGPQGSPPGLVIQGIEGPKSPDSPVSPTFFLPSSPGVSTGSGPVKGWKMKGPNPDGKYKLVKNKSRPDDAGQFVQRCNPGKRGCSPSGVLDLAAQGSVYGIRPGHTVAKRGGAVAVNSHLGQTWVGQPGVMGLVPVTAFGIGVGKPGMGMAHVKPEVRQVGMWQPGMIQVGIRQVSTNQYQETTQLQQTADTSGILKAPGINSPEEDNTTAVVNTIISVETDKTQPSNEEVLKKKVLKDTAQNMHYNIIEEKHNVITYTSILYVTKHQRMKSLVGWSKLCNLTKWHGR